MNLLIALTFAFALITVSPNILAGEGHDHGEVIQSLEQSAQAGETDDHDHDEHTETLSTEIPQEYSASSGIRIGIAAPGKLSRTIRAYGRVAMPPGQISHIRARYEGLLKEVAVDVGDVVKAGDLLAKVESNDSLTNYAILSPIDGTVTQRHANAGELAADQVLFSVADQNKLWVEFRIFESQLADVRQGQIASIASETQTTVTEIRSIIPSLDEHPFVIALAMLDNTHNSWSPGMFVTGDIEVEKVDAQLVIENKAIQTMEGRTGIFIQNNDHYEFRPLSTGKRDSQFTEVLSGLSPGERYVKEMSFLVKADIEKAGAEHEH